jgi:hypothetical protein
MHLCRDGGFVVGGREYWLPSDPRDFFGACFGIFAIGCNALGCQGCGERVRAAVGRWDLSAIHRVPAHEFFGCDWSSFRLSPEGEARLYACRCGQTLVRGPAGVSGFDADELRVEARWRCSGHPALELPGRFADLELSAFPDWSALVARWIGAVATQQTEARLERHPGFVLTRLSHALGYDAARDALSRCVAERGVTGSAEERVGAVLYFAQSPRAVGFDLVLARWRENPAHFDDLVWPYWAPRGLRQVLVEIAASRHALLGGEVASLEALRWAATTAPGIGAGLVRLRMMDRAWVEQHVEALFAANPSGWKRTLHWLDLTEPELLVRACEGLVSKQGVTAAEVMAVLTESFPARAELVRLVGERLSSP